MWWYYGTQYRVRLYPPFEYSISHKENNLTGFNDQKTLLNSTHSESSDGRSFCKKAWPVPVVACTSDLETFNSGFD